ncbi:hypothetical protein J3F83DRAFT_732190 [Trichoderma novae-zelandiae]
MTMSYKGQTITSSSSLSILLTSHQCRGGEESERRSEGETVQVAARERDAVWLTLSRPDLDVRFHLHPQLACHGSSQAPSNGGMACLVLCIRSLSRNRPSLLVLSLSRLAFLCPFIGVRLATALSRLLQGKSDYSYATEAEAAWISDDPTSTTSSLPGPGSIPTAESANSSGRACRGQDADGIRGTARPFAADAGATGAGLMDRSFDKSVASLALTPFLRTAASVE